MKYKSLIFSLSLITSFSSQASLKSDYWIKIGTASRNEKSAVDIVIEAINKGIYKANDRTEDEKGNKYYTLGSVFTETYPYITDPNFFKVTSENARGLKFLLEKGLDPNQKFIEGLGSRNTTLLLAAAGSCNLEAVKLLIKYGADINASIPDKFMPVASRESNIVTEARGSNMNFITQDVSIDQDLCFQTFKFLIEDVGINIRERGCTAFSELDGRNKAIVRYFNYVNEKFGKDFTDKCYKLDDELVRNFPVN